MNLKIETPRLLIRLVDNSDADDMFLMDSDPEVQRFLGNHPVKSLDETLEQIEKIQKQYVDYGVGRWAVCLRENNRFIGWTGFRLITETVNGHSNYYDFGYRLQRVHWGKGYATEAGRAALEYGLHQLRLSPVHATVDPDNAASRKVLGKLGFKITGVFPYDGLSPWRAAGLPTLWLDLQPPYPS